MRLSASLFLFGASRGAAFGGSTRRSVAAAASAISLKGSGSTFPLVAIGSSLPFVMANPSACPTSRRISRTLLGATHSALYSRGGSTAPSSSSTALNSAVADETEKAEPLAKYRKDYRPLPHLVTKISMDFDIHDGETTVTSKLTIEPNAKFTAQEGESSDLVLDGDETCVSLISLSIDGRDLEEGTDYVLAPGTLAIKNSALKPGAVLETKVKIVPEDNTQLAGLYKSGSMYCSQCEATGELACCLSFLSYALYKMMNSDFLNFLHIFACLVLPHKQDSVALPIVSRTLTLCIINEMHSTLCWLCFGWHV